MIPNELKEIVWLYVSIDDILNIMNYIKDRSIMSVYRMMRRDVLMNREPIISYDHNYLGNEDPVYVFQDIQIPTQRYKQTKKMIIVFNDPIDRLIGRIKLNQKGWYFLAIRQHSKWLNSKALILDNWVIRDELLNECDNNEYIVVRLMANVFETPKCRIYLIK